MDNTLADININDTMSNDDYNLQTDAQPSASPQRLKIQVAYRYAYGKDRFYPVCPIAKAILQVVNQRYRGTCFAMRDIEVLRQVFDIIVTDDNIPRHKKCYDKRVDGKQLIKDLYKR